MNRLLLILALVAALFAGWAPAMAGSLHAAAIASGHAEHADQAANHDHADHGGKRHATVHPLLCSACFALPPEAGRIAPPPARFIGAMAYIVTLVGGEVLPPDPPPRASSF